ncbi:MAG: TonB-dependent receptor [Ginsengibacter sp.]
MQSRAHFTLASLIDIQKAGWRLSAQMLLNRKWKWFDLNFRFISRKQNWLVMKLTAILLLSACLQVSANGFSQDISLSAKNVTLQKVFRQIHKQSGYQFFYEDGMLNKAGRININVKDMPLEKVLTICFKGLPLSYSITNNVITVNLKTEDPVQRMEAPVFISIQGVVKDAQGNPLAGVSVIVKRTQKGTSTGTDGRFTIDANVGDELEFTMIGYQKKTITIGQNRNITVVMEIEETTGNEIIIIGYGTQKKSDVTGAISSYTPKEDEAARSVSVDEMLQGKIPGMNVTNSASGPGAASSVIIRGANSLRGDNQPLYIIDNIPQSSTGQFAGNVAGDNQIPENPLTTLNPNDIESIQVLKDASATAIYGSRGANGVIIITTKKGKSGKAKITFNTNVTTASVTRKRDMLNLKEYADFRNQQVGGGNANSFYFDGGQIRYVFSGDTYDPTDDSSYHILTEKNWQNEIYRNAISNNNNLSISGGSGKTTYFLSASYKNIQGIVKSTNMQIGDLRLNVNTELSKKLKLSVMLNGGIRGNNMMTGGDTRGGVSGSIISTAVYSAPFIYPQDDPILNNDLDARTSVLSWLSDYDDLTNEKTFRASTELTWKISNMFSYSFRSGANITLQDRSRWFGLQLFQGLNNNGFLTTSNLNRNNYTVENLLNFNKKIGDIVNITALAGVTYDKYSFLNKLVSGNNFQNFILKTNGMNFASNVTVYQPFQKDYQLMSYLSRVNLSFLEDRFIATINFRADGSSKFAPNNRWGYFPSMAIAWRMENEKFIQNLDWINQLKLRIGYGKTGSQAIDPYSTLSFYSQNSYYADNLGNRLLAINVSGLPNKDLRWESTSSYNGGVDFAVLDSRISGSLDVYYKETNNLLISRDIPPSTSFTNVIINQGALSNRGVELNLNGDVIRNKDLNFSIGGNISFNTPKIIKLGLPQSTFGKSSYVAYLGNAIGDHYGVGNIFIQGQAPGLFWGYKTDGIYQTGENISIKKDLLNSVPTPGAIKFVDQNGDSIINSSDMTIIGNPNPKFTYGFNASLRYKNFTLNANFYGVYGNQILNANLRDEATPSKQSPNLRENALLNAWTPTNASNTYPSLTQNIPNVVMDRYIENGSFLRMSNLTLGYTLPQFIPSKIGLNSINVYATGTNLFLITKYSGNDPEVNSFAFDGLRPGIDYNSFPNVRSFIFGLNIKF